MSYHHLSLIDEAGMASARHSLGTSFARILGYFHQDGIASVFAIETAMYERDPTPMVIPAHSLKGESRQLGAGQLSALAEHLEMTARRCIEDRARLPDALDEDVRGLRAVFQRTVRQLEERVALEAASAIQPARAVTGQRRAVFGRRIV